MSSIERRCTPHGFIGPLEPLKSLCARRHWPAGSGAFDVICDYCGTEFGWHVGRRLRNNSK